MRSLAFGHYIKTLSRTSALGLVSFALIGCSTDFSRFSSVYQDAAPKAALTDNRYPSNVDPTTTASVDRRIVPVGEVANAPTPQATYHTPEPTQVTPNYGGNDANYSQSQPEYQPVVKKQALPALDAPKPVLSADPVVTGSVRKPLSSVENKPVELPRPLNTQQVATQVESEVSQTVERKVTAEVPRSAGGWSKVGGSAVSLRSGETLYNLSRRYGVPVKEIMAANGIANADAVQAGQSILIPTYVYSQNAPVSAPDNNPKTKAARASSGMQGEVSGAKAATPVYRPAETAALSSVEGSSEPERKTRRKLQAAPPTNENAPDYSIVTGSVNSEKKLVTSGVYAVKAGDSLGRIAKLYGVSTADLKKRNGIAGSNINIGQRLVIPDATYVVTNEKKLNAKPDPLVTNSVSAPSIPSKPEKVMAEGPKEYVKPQKMAKIDTGDSKDAPKATGIVNFRWPVRGRVVTNFGGGSDGIAISVPQGTAVKATENGKVIYVGDEIAAYGKLVLIRHENDWVSAYAHNSAYEVKKGEQVRRGQTIARSGKTGDADRPKLHFELRKNANPVNPLKHLGS